MKELIETGQGFYEHQVEYLLHLNRVKYGDILYLGPSFPAIAGSGPNGAIVHYRPVKG